MNKSEQLIACLEAEIAKRDARIMGLESQYQRDVWGLNNEGDPIGGEPAGGYANDNARLRAELAAIEAQGVVILDESQEAAEFESQFQGCKAFMRDSNASEAAGKYVCQRSHMFKVWMHFRAMLAATAAPAADAGLVAAFCKVEQALDLIGGIRHGKNVTQDELWQSCELLDTALAAHSAKGVV